MADDRRLLRRVAVAGFAIGIPANIAYALTGGLEQEDARRVFEATVFYALGVVPLGLAYAASFALLWPRARSVLRHFSAPGRTALTNYLGHTIFGIVIFYGVGFGLYRSVGPWTFSGIALLIYFALAVASQLWLRRFPQGPMEALWRRLTYAGHSRPPEVLAH